MARFRSLAITVSSLAAVTNILSAYLFQQFPDDPYHLAHTFSTYEHFASVLSLLGVIGAIREHAFSVAIFATYFLVDTILCSVPRFAVLLLLSSAQEHICSPILVDLALSDPSASASSSSSVSSSSVLGSYRADAVEPLWSPPDWSEAQCAKVVWLLQAVLFVGAVGVTFVQLVFALQVREYARSLLVRDKEMGIVRVRDEEKMLVDHLERERGKERDI